MADKKEATVTRYSDVEIRTLSQQLLGKLESFRFQHPISLLTSSTNDLANLLLLLRQHHFALDLQPMRPHGDGVITHTHLIFGYPPCDLFSKLPRSRMETLENTATVTDLISKIKLYLSDLTYY